MLASHTQKPRISALEKSRRRANQNDRTGLSDIVEHNLDVSFLTRRRGVPNRRKANDTTINRGENMSGKKRRPLPTVLNLSQSLTKSPLKEVNQT
jgi:hypothetical protein